MLGVWFICRGVYFLYAETESPPKNNFPTAIEENFRQNNIFVSVGKMLHDDVMKWKHFPRYWPFVRGIHRSPVNSPVTRSFGVFFDLRLNKRLSKQSWGWWFETLSRQLWRYRIDGYPQPHLVRGIVVCICMSLWSSLWLFSVCLFDKPSMIIDGLVQDCSNSIAKALELLQSCTKPSIWFGLVKCTLGPVTLL